MESEKKRLLSKSQALIFLRCRKKWKESYIDGIQFPSSPQQERGKRVHDMIEHFYKKTKIIDGELVTQVKDKDLDIFIENEKRRMEILKEKGKMIDKYFRPAYQEEWLVDEELGLKGYVDAVYINPDDDKLIVIDWKTGNFYNKEESLNGYRFELAVYTELLRKIRKADVGYWGIYFTDQDKLFYEKIDENVIKEMIKKMDYVRDEIKNQRYPPKKECDCMWCRREKIQKEFKDVI